MKIKTGFMSVKNGQKPDFENGIIFSIKNYVGKHTSLVWEFSYNIVVIHIIHNQLFLTEITPFFPILHDRVKILIWEESQFLDAYLLYI